MGIKITQPGEAAAAAQTGKMIGRGKRAQEERARAEREQARAQQAQAQQKARQAALEWEQQKMAMRSQQDFQQELAAKQWDYEKFNRAKAWDIEKMEMRSRLDFEKEEKKRAEKEVEIAAGVKAIRESTDIYPDQKAMDKAEFDFVFKKQYGAAPRLLQEEKPPTATRQKGEIEAALELDAMGYTPQHLRELGLDPNDFPLVGREVEGAELPTPTTQADLPPIKEGLVWVTAPNGEIGTLSEEELLEDKYKNYKRLEGPPQEVAQPTEEIESLAERTRRLGGEYGSISALLKSPLGMALDYYKLKGDLPLEVKERLTQEEKKRLAKYYRSRGLNF